ncbi:1,4-alpha-glucan branching protein [Streptomyces sp. SID13726]|uniref:maltokinase N-terminal cap-like domain-containing protein n=1 Tax=Streptomyces sp. SID13726 TaxID=2706058 RepID=UPI0013B8A7B8|nr:1,4-alpha-glucan branching protein [Streptomyces sp. SID13726]NEB04990.1 1,4-alpha-glucan branching protein [Streptomyces sp. SID13726]
MAIIHRTTLKPTKLELLTAWLPTRPWYVGAGTPELTKAGGFRLDDPEGEVGIEFMVAVDSSGPEPVAYLVPLTYRAAPLPGAEHALVGTMEHGVLGPRWAYDGTHDPVLRTELLALIEGRVRAQAQSVSDALDDDVVRSYAGPGLPTGPAQVTEDQDGTGLSLPGGTVLTVHRVLSPAVPEAAAGHVAGAWDAPDGTRARGVFATLRTP